MEQTGALREKKVEKLISEAVGSESKLNPIKHSIFHKIVEYVEYTEKGFSVAELIPAAEEMIEGSAFLSVASSGASILSIALFPINALMEILDAYEISLKMYSLRSVAYTVTAWAFNKTIPMESRQSIFNLTHGFPAVKPKDLVEYNKIWHKTSVDTLHKIKTGLLLKNVKPEDAKVIFRALSDGMPDRLSTLLLKGMEENIESPIFKKVWISNYRITYPY